MRRFATELSGRKPECEILLCCARATLDGETVSRITYLLSQELDWQRVLFLAKHHRVAPLLWHSLRKLRASSLPQSVSDWLQGYHENNGVHNQRIAEEMLRLLKEFESCGIPAIPYKGATLASTLYQDHSLREFLDIDLIVPEQDVWRARDALRARGYRPQDPMAPHQEALYFSSECEYILIREDFQFAVELHWLIVPRYFSLALDMEGMWQRAGETPFEGQNVLSLGREDMLLCLCVHGMKHDWARLSLVCDVAEFVHKYPALDWDLTLREAKRTGIRRILILGLNLAHVLLKLPLPEQVWREIRKDLAGESLTQSICESFFEREPAETDCFRFRMRVRERARDQFGYCYLFQVYMKKRRRAGLFYEFLAFCHWKILLVEATRSAAMASLGLLNRNKASLEAESRHRATH